MKTVVVDPFDKASINAAVDVVNKLIAKIETPTELLQKLMQPAASIARVKFATAQINSDDAKDANIDVGVTISGKVATLYANGDEVGFIEFGTGVFNPDWTGDPRLDYEPPPHGTYGLGRGNARQWHYTNDVGETVFTTGLVPAEAMLSAWRYVVENAVNVGREVYGND